MASNTTISLANITLLSPTNNTMEPLQDNNTSMTDISATTLSLSKSSQEQELMLTISANIRIVSYTLLPVVFAIGIFGNVLTLIIMSMDKKITSMASRYILILLAVCDMTMLVTHVFNKQGVRQLIGFDVRAQSVAGCKAFLHIYRTAKMMSSWLVVILCVERFIAVVFPLKVKVILTKKRIVSWIVCTFLLLVTFNAMATHFTTIVKSKNSIECKQYVEPKENKTMYRIVLVVSNFLFSWLPLTVMSILTPKIIFTLKKRLDERESLSTTTQKGTETTRISAMLVGVVIAYVIFITPVTLLHINNSFVSLGLKKNTPEFLIVKEIVQYLEMMNFTTNFIMYAFGSVGFRHKAIRLFCGCRTMNATSLESKQSSSGIKVTESSAILTLSSPKESGVVEEDTCTTTSDIRPDP